MKDPTAPEVKPIEPKPVTIDVGKSALMVLELSQFLEDPEYFAAPLVPGVTKLLEKARLAGILTIFTIPGPWEGKPQGQVYSGFKRKTSEFLFFPHTFNKFADGRLQTLLSLYGVNTLIMVGCKANMALLYTASTAATELNYNIVIPVDGIAATTEYERDYTLYQLRRFPGGFTQRFTFTKIDMISFQSGAK